MPWLLYRYMMGELLRVFALTAGVLVLVIAFGAAIKPLAADNLIGPLQTAKYIMLATVPMLQFALPFSAGFAATLVFHRLTSDNEILAASVSGISYRRILMPVAGLGLVLVGVMVLLTQWIIPHFWASMDRIIAHDVTRLVQSSIERGMPVQFGNVQIYADRLMVLSSPPDTGAESRLVLFRVVAAQLDRNNRIITDVAARQAVVDVHRREGRTYLKMVLADAVAYNAMTGQMAHTPELTPDAIVVPASFQDDPMFLSQDRMLWLRDHLDEHSLVIEAKEGLAVALRRMEVRDHISAALAARGAVELAGGWGGSDRLIVSADGFEQGRFMSTGARPVLVQELAGSQLVREISAERAAIDWALGFTVANPTVDLVLDNCQVVDMRAQGAVNRRDHLPIPELSLVGLVADDPSSLPYPELLALADRSGDEVKARARRLADVIDELRREITSRLQRRYALSLTAMLLLLLGATMAIWLRHSLPLVIYVWAFLPSIGNMLLISSGDHMIRSGIVVPGTVVLWSGVGLLAASLGFVYMQVMRN